MSLTPRRAGGRWAGGAAARRAAARPRQVMMIPAATAAAAMASSRAGSCPANQAAPPSPSPAPASEPTSPMIVPSVITSRASVLSRQPKLRMVASSAARSGCSGTPRRRRPARRARPSPRPRRSRRPGPGPSTALPSSDPTTTPRKATVTAVSIVSAAMPMARLATPISGAAGGAGHVEQGQRGDAAGLVRAAHGQHRRPDRADRVGPGGQPGRRQAGHDGHRDRDGDRQQRAGRGGVQAQRRGQRRDRSAASSPATSPIPASSPSTVANSRDRRQPTAASTPSSRRRPRTAAVAALPTNSTHTTRISVNSATLLLSTAFRIATATPFFTQFSDRVSGGWPNLPAGRSMVAGTGRSRPRCPRPGRCAGRSAAATALIRFRGTARFGPVTPATRTRITLIGARRQLRRAGVPAVLQRRQRRQRGDQVHRLADQATQVLAGQQVRRRAAPGGWPRRPAPRSSAGRRPAAPATADRRPAIFACAEGPGQQAGWATTLRLRVDRVLAQRPVLAVGVVHRGDLEVVVRGPHRGRVADGGGNQVAVAGAPVAHRADAPVRG